MLTVSRTGTEYVVAATLSVVPSAEVLAIVRYDDPPARVPDELAPYVVAGLEGTHDWLLTDDALAFGDPTLPQRFGEWRATWERTWILDAYSGLSRLSASAAAPGEPKPFERTISDSIDTDAGRILPPDLLTATIDEVGRVNELVLRSELDGFGFIDATPGQRSAGMARTWSPIGGDELLAANAGVYVNMRVHDGMSVDVLPGDGSSVASVSEVDRVELHGDEVLVVGANGRLVLADKQAHCLAWIVPGATKWRVRRIPHAVVWARTFTGLRESCEYALSIGRPVLLTTRRPFV